MIVDHDYSLVCAVPHMTRSTEQCYALPMSFDDDKKKRKLKEAASSSSPEGWRKDKRTELKKQVEEYRTKDELTKLRTKQLKADIQEKEESSRPTKDRRQEVASADESVAGVDPKEFAERTEKREEERQAAMDQAPQEEGENAG